MEIARVRAADARRQRVRDEGSFEAAKIGVDRIALAGRGEIEGDHFRRRRTQALRAKTKNSVLRAYPHDRIRALALRSLKQSWSG